MLPPHIGGPAASLCDVPEVALADGGSAKLTMTVSNEGGYCAARVATSVGKAFDSYVLPLDSLPAHGTAKITEYDGKTSIEYTPSVAYAGKDSFGAKLIIAGKPGYTSVSVAVTVKDRAAEATTSSTQAPDAEDAQKTYAKPAAKPATH